MIIECAICYENLQLTDSIFHTPCGHVFHYSCLSQWLKRSPSCPECRQDMMERDIRRLYLNFVNSERSIEDAITLSFQTQISGLNDELLIKELEIIESNSNNRKLTGLVKLRDTEIIRLQTNIRMTEDENRLMKSLLESRNGDLEVMRRGIARITKERDDIMSSNRSWDKVSQMFHGITDHNALIEMIGVMKEELATCTNTRWELQRTVMELERELAEAATKVRICGASERSKKCEMESDLAICEIEKVLLRHRIDELERLVDPDLEANDLLSHMTVEDSVKTTCNSIPLKKRKLCATDKLTAIADVSTTPIDVIDLTVETAKPLIDLTTDIMELS